MYGKRFVTGDRQKACLFEQKGSYMASIKDSNGQFKTLQLGTNRPVAFKQFFAAASAAGYDMRSVAKEQGVDPEVKLNREQRRKLAPCPRQRTRWKIASSNYPSTEIRC